MTSSVTSTRPGIRGARRAHGCRPPIAVSIRPHVMAEHIVGNLRATRPAPVEVEPVVNATPHAAVRLVNGESRQAGVGLCIHHLTSRRIPGDREALCVTP